MSDVAVHHLCVPCGHATSSNDMYRYHIIQREYGACRLCAIFDASKLAVRT